MNIKSDTNPMKPVQRANRLFAITMILFSVLMVTTIPGFFGTERNILVFALLGVSLVVFAMMFIANTSLSESQKKRMLESDDYCNEAINKGLRYGWVAILLFMALLMPLELYMDFALSGTTITRMGLAIVLGIPPTVYLLLTRDDSQESAA